MLRHKSRANISLMRNHASRAIFDAVFRIREIASALGPEHIERTIAKQAIEFSGIYALMTREVWARAMREERIFVSLLCSHEHQYSNAQRDARFRSQLSRAAHDKLQRTSNVSRHLPLCSVY